MKEEVKKSIGLFSEETLDSIAMAELMGGDTNTYCNGGNCVPQCGCGSKSGSGSCNTVPVNAGAGSCTNVNCPTRVPYQSLFPVPVIDVSTTPYITISD